MNPNHYQDQFLKENLEREAREFEQRVGKDIIEFRIQTIKTSLDIFNRVFGSTLRLNIQTVEAMIISCTSVPLTAGMDIMNRPGYKDMSNLLHAIRLALIRDRDAKVKFGYPQLPDSDNKTTGI